MGLAGRKVKQRIGADPRNLTWADDASKFGQSYLAKFGWDSSQGLGVAGDGRTSHIKVAQKLDVLGIGAAQQQDPNGIAWKQNKDFERLLQRLNEQKSEQAIESTVEPVEEEKSGKKRKLEEDEGSQKKRKTIARHRPHRARAIAAKSMTAKSTAAVLEILGLASTPSESMSPVTTTEVLGLEQITTSSKSVSDYFKERLQAKTRQTHVEEDSPRAGLDSRSPLPQEKIKKTKKEKEGKEERRKKRRKDRDSEGS